MADSGASQGTQAKARWDASNATTNHAHAFQLSADRAEIVLSFGTKTGQDPATAEPIVEVSDRVVVSPATAKRLAAILAHAVRDYEWRHGPLGGEALPPPAPLGRRGRAARTPASLTEALPPRGVELLGLVDGLGVHAVLERSFKMFENTLLPNRFLWGFKRDAVADPARLLAACERLGMSGRFQEAFRAGLADANIVFFGFEEHERGARYKAYLEFGDRLAVARAEHPDAPPPVLIYLGFKWDADEPTKGSVARYTCHPGLTAPQMVERMRQAFYGGASTTSFDIARAIVARAVERAGPDRFLFFETTEDDNPRSSFDINLYNAQLRLEELYPQLLEMCRHFGVSSERFHAAYTPVRSTLFGHVTGGLDRAGKDFLSIYFGGEQGPAAR